MCSRTSRTCDLESEGNRIQGARPIVGSKRPGAGVVSSITTPWAVLPKLEQRVGRLARREIHIAEKQDAHPATVRLKRKLTDEIPGREFVALVKASRRIGITNFERAFVF